MNERKEGQGAAAATSSTGKETPPEMSPDDKLKDDDTASFPIPGAQNPESKEIKGEVNLNTE